MNGTSLQKRLSQITTRWTFIRRAQGLDSAERSEAYGNLLERYQTAAHRYLLAAIGDRDAADELFQDFALKIVRGDFRSLDPNKGLFRDYVKTVLINMVINYQKKQRRRSPMPLADPDQLQADETIDQPDEDFLTNWRLALLERAWQALAEQEEPGGPPFYSALRSYSESADMTAAQLAAEMTAQRRPKQPYTETGIRKIIQRGREKFAELLVDEVARSLLNPTQDELMQEVIDLGFNAYCKKALEKRRACKHRV